MAGGHLSRIMAGVALALIATGAGFWVAVGGSGGGEARAETVTVYYSPDCGCCSEWIDHLERHGFQVDGRHTDDLSAVKAELDIDRRLESCHTAQVGGYLVEGHVPADEIRRMLDDAPDIRGLAVPGMPHGSPGMEGLYNEDYEVLRFGGEGGIQVFSQRHGGDHL